MNRRTKKMKKIVISAFSALTGAIVGICIFRKRMLIRLKKIQALSDKHLSLFLMMTQWVKIRQKNKILTEYFERKGYRNIAVYGISYAGEALIEELKNTDINIIYGIDKKAEAIYTKIDVISSDDTFPKVDAVVVTAITFFDEIKMELSKKLECPIISLEEILYEL